MTTLPERLQDVIAEMQSYVEQEYEPDLDKVADWLARLEAATALQPSVGGVVGYVDAGMLPVLAKQGGSIMFGEYSERYGRTTPLYIASPAQADGWVLISESEPPRNECVVYWHLTVDGSAGFPAIADEWRAEHHAEYASHWHPSASAAPSAPRWLGVDRG